MKRILHFFIVPLLSIAALGLVIWNYFPQFIPWHKFPVCDRCNVVIIDIDILRADALSCLGSVRDTSPNICEFFKNGVIFEQNIAQSVWTLPSIFSTMTSQYPFTHGIYKPFQNTLSLKIPTMAEILKNSGYTTTWVGSIGGSSNISTENGGTRGFDHLILPSFRSLGWDQIAKQELVKNSPVFIYFYSGELHLPYLLREGEAPIENLKKPEGFPLSTQDFLSSLADYLKKYPNLVFTIQAMEERPDIFSRIENVDKYKILEFFQSFDTSKYSDHLAKFVNGDSSNAIYESYVRHIYSENKEEQLNRLNFVRMLYDTKVAYVDNKLQALLKILEIPEISRNTVVILISEHGEAFMEHGLFSHLRQPYNELLHTPLFIKIPGVGPKKLTPLTQNIDILPTVMDAVGIRHQFTIQGNSLIPLIAGKSRPEEIYAISFVDYSGISIQNYRWKLIADFSVSPKPTEVYNLENDPEEQNNIIESNKQITDELLKILIEKMAKSKIIGIP